MYSTAPMSVNAPLPFRTPWILYPHVPDLLPPVELYSLIVANLPETPPNQGLNSSAMLGVTSSDVCAVPPPSSLMQYQLESTVAFFHDAIPPARGSLFSSSVVAITVLPNPKRLATVWRLWAQYVKMQRRLNYVQGLVAERSGTVEQYGIPETQSNKGLIQTGKYSLEYSRAGGNCCPVGQCVGIIDKLTIEDLRDLEDDLVEELNGAQKEWKVARRKAIKLRKGSTLFEPSPSSATVEVTDFSSKKKDGGGGTRWSSQDWGYAERGSDRQMPLRRANPVPEPTAAFFDVDIEAGVGAVADVTPGADSGAIEADYRPPSRIFRVRAFLGDCRRTAKGWRCGRRGVLGTIDEALQQDGGSYAVLTFASRQAALAARKITLDGRGGPHALLSFPSIPVPPLSDAAPLDVVTCRNCCRPVAFSISPWRKKLRGWIAFVCLILIYAGYTIPIAFIANLTSFNDPNYPILSLLTGLIPGLLQSIFIGLSPLLFKHIANSGSGALNLLEADTNTLKYYWYFQLTTCFTGSFFSGILVGFLTFGTTGVIFPEGSTFRDAVNTIASNLPTVSSAVWLNWILIVPW